MGGCRWISVRIAVAAVLALRGLWCDIDADDRRRSRSSRAFDQLEVTELLVVVDCTGDDGIVVD